MDDFILCIHYTYFTRHTLICVFKLLATWPQKCWSVYTGSTVHLNVLLSVGVQVAKICTISIEGGSQQPGSAQQSFGSSNTNTAGDFASHMHRMWQIYSLSDTKAYTVDLPVVPMETRLVGSYEVRWGNWVNVRRWSDWVRNLLRCTRCTTVNSCSVISEAS